MKYLRKCRDKLGGHLPQRRPKSFSIPTPPLETLKAVLDGSGDREISTTMAFGILSQLVKDKDLGKRIVPILADEARTSAWKACSASWVSTHRWGSCTSRSTATVMYYREEKDGQILQEGLNEAGAFSSFIAAGTAYSNYNQPMLPVYIFYSMFGFQRIGDCLGGRRCPDPRLPAGRHFRAHHAQR